MIGSCLAGTMCTCLCSAFQCCGASSKVFSRIGYALFAFVWIVLSTLLLYFAHYITISALYNHLGCTDAATRDSCIGLSSVYRMSFSLVVFHLVFFLLCSCRNEVIAKLNEGAWPLKFLAVLAFFGLTFIIPNGFFRIYGYIAMGGSFLFLVYEMILIIDMAYSWNAAWVGNYNTSQETSGSATCWTIMLIIGTLLATGGGITVYVFMIKDYGNSSMMNMVVLIIPLVAGALYFVLTVTQIARGGSIFTCGLFFFFQSFISMSIILSKPGTSTQGTLLGQIVIGLAFLFFVIFYAGIRTEKPAGEEATDAKATSEKVTNVLAEPAEKEVLTSDDKEAPPEITTKTMMFHLFMAFASLYYSMVLSNWGSPKINSQPVVRTFSNEHLAYGVMLAAQWIGILFFIWSLIASRVCKSRDFGDS